MDNNQSGIGDDELNKMIASLQQQRNGGNDGVSPVGQKIIQPPVQVQPVQSQVKATQPETPSINDNELNSIRQKALVELRPLVNKLDLNPQDKFDTLLLLIRSTDDSSLIAEAHDTALAISDDARRAQALLDIVKEIDFFERQK